MENATMTCPLELSGLGADDQEVFRRVWARVMPQASQDCPIVVGGDLPCTCVCPPPPEAETPAPPEEALSPHRGSDFAEGGQVARLGPASSVHGGQLQRQVSDALECWQLYRHLARRASGSGGRILSALASEKHQAARRLAAAYFLISGVRYWPADRLTTPGIPSYLGTVRRAYQTEQQREQAYHLAAADTGDEALAELYRDLALQCMEHSALLRALLEQSRL